MQTIEQFYALLKDIVQRNAPCANDCDVINSFVVSGNEQTYSQEQLNVNHTEREKPYFYSRRWEEDNFPTGSIKFDYPLLAVVHGGTTISDLYLLDSDRDRVVNLEIGVFEKYVIDGDTVLTSNPCSQRNVEEIWGNCERLLIDTLKRLDAYEAYQDIVTFEKSYLPASSSGYSGKVKVKSDTAVFKGELRRMENIELRRWQGGANNLYGIYAQIQIHVSLC